MPTSPFDIIKMNADIQSRQLAQFNDQLDKTFSAQLQAQQLETEAQYKSLSFMEAKRVNTEQIEIAKQRNDIANKESIARMGLMDLQAQAAETDLKKNTF